MPNKLVAWLAIISAQIFAGMFAVSALASPVPVTVTVTNLPGFQIPADFCGLSFGAVAELPGHGDVPGLMFSPTNTQLITLFKNSGLHHLRLGGTTVEGLDAAVPDRAAIDNVFGFAKAAGIKVIYSLPLLNGSAITNAVIAKYISDHYRAYLDYFAIGNEPDVRKYAFPPFGSGTDPAITNYATFLSQWRLFASAITNAVPGAKFAGPDTAGRNWSAPFAADERDSGIVSLITQHLYIGGRPYIGEGPETIPVQTAIDNILSTNWILGKIPAFYDHAIVPVKTNGIPFRMTESDDYLKGVPNASDSFATALWGLEYLHWWAAHGCVGVDFHNTEWLKTDTVFFDEASHSYRINPKAYGIKAFEIGSQGGVEPVVVSNAYELNLSAYAVGDTQTLYVTVLNKEHGANGHDAAVTITSAGCNFRKGAVIFLLSPNRDAGATNGMTLGDGTIANNIPWRGKWKTLKLAANGNCVLTLPAAAAAVVKLALQ